MDWPLTHWPTDRATPLRVTTARDESQLDPARVPEVEGDGTSSLRRQHFEWAARVGRLHFALIRVVTWAAPQNSIWWTESGGQNLVGESGAQHLTEGTWRGESGGQNLVGRIWWANLAHRI